MKEFVIDLDGRQFKKNYLIYVIDIEHKDKGQYFYIGQTGDRNHITARPAFRRLAAHFEDQGRSTQNQVYRAIAVKVLGIKEADRKDQPFSAITKKRVSDFLVDSKTKMRVFPIRDFADTTTTEEHHKNRNFVESLEKRVIQKFIDNYGQDRLLNKKILPPDKLDNLEIERLTKEIIKRTCR
jgi:hypothetical protein